jgi:hypothetical protein
MEGGPCSDSVHRSYVISAPDAIGPGLHAKDF